MHVFCDPQGTVRGVVTISSINYCVKYMLALDIDV